jgi:aminopeptidase YwaD
MRVARALGLAVLAAALTGAGPATPAGPWLLDHVRALAAPEMEGRASGTAGAERAAHYVAAQMQRLGLRPGGDAGTWEQAFTVPTGIRLGSVNALEVLAPARRALSLGRDFAPLPVSAEGRQEAELVFAGYGITAPDLGWDDYAGVEVRGRIVLVLEHEPRRADPAGPFRRPEAYHYIERSHKIINAREHGALAVLLVVPGETRPPLTGHAQSHGILVAAVTPAVADALLAPIGLDSATRAIDAGPGPRSFAVPGARVALQVSLVRDRGRAANVVGILPGRDMRLRDEAVVIGAHYDHLGRGGQGSLAPEATGHVHPGADDNASGVAAMLGLARAFVEAGGSARTLVFAAFAGEEMGLLGSAHYVRRPAHPLERTVLMLNLDMVGRLRAGTLYVSGVDSGTGLRALVQAQAEGLTLSLRGDPYGPSDHVSFYAAGRPVLFLFTGAHPDYHRPTDTWDRVDAAGLAQVTAFAARIVDSVAAAATPPAYARVAAPGASSSRAGGYGPFFGVVPEFGETEGSGVRVGGVRAGSPADKAGVRPGDVIVAFGGLTVRTLEDFTFALRGRRPGDRVEVTVLREGAERRLDAVLEERK